MKEKLIKLIDFKSIITFIVIVAMVVFTYLNIIGPELFVTTCGAVVNIFLYKEKKKYRKKIEIRTIKKEGE